jgi:hypothetical protein
MVNFLTIENSATSYLNGYEVKLIQMNGGQVFITQLEQHKQTLDLSELPAGAYILQIINGSNKVKEQIILKQ